MYAEWAIEWTRQMYTSVKTSARSPMADRRAIWYSRGMDPRNEVQMFSRRLNASLRNPDAIQSRRPHRSRESLLPAQRRDSRLSDVGDPVIEARLRELGCKWSAVRELDDFAEEDDRLQVQLVRTDQVRRMRDEKARVPR